MGQLYVNDLRDGQWTYFYAGANAVGNVYFYSEGHRGGGRGNVNHRDGLKLGSMMPGY
jgi:hypothetical protein